MRYTQRALRVDTLTALSIYIQNSRFYRLTELWIEYSHRTRCSTLNTCQPSNKPTRQPTKPPASQAANHPASTSLKSVIWRLVPVVCCRMSVVYLLLSVLRCSLAVIFCSLPVVCSVQPAVCCQFCLYTHRTLDPIDSQQFRSYRYSQNSRC